MRRCLRDTPNGSTPKRLNGRSRRCTRSATSFLVPNTTPDLRRKAAAYHALAPSRSGCRVAIRPRMRHHPAMSLPVARGIMAWTLAAAWPWLAACAGNDLCASLQGRRFESVELLDCGMDANGDPVACNWTLDFRNGRYAWTRGAVQEIGDYTCDADTITGTTDDVTRTATFDEASGVMTWEGEAYRSP